MSEIELTKLNPDILCVVMGFVADDDDAGISTIAAISRTCKRMRFEGTKYLLSGTVELHLVDEICSFCHFMLADKPARLPLLKALVLSSDLLEEDGHIELLPGRTYEYPHLQKLTLPIYSSFMPYMKPFIVSAPYLRELQFGGMDSSHTRHQHDEDILRGRIVNKTRIPAQEWRTTNERDQEATGKSWPMLDSFKGAIIGAYATGLSCPVARVHLLSTGGRRSTELAMLSIVLSDWRPSFLHLATKTYRTRGYIPILPPASSGWAEALETLELSLNVVDDRFNPGECFDHIKQTLSTLHVTSLRLDFRCVNSRTQHMEIRHPPLDPFEGEECERPGSYQLNAVCYMQNELLREDLPQRVRECMRSSPALRRMTLAWGRCCTRGPNRVICVDMDNVPHVWDRPGDDSDGWGKPDRDW
ncbi:hypothetical protein C8T65DRAFT_828509 [Cerioporus squamosus]|nr:hypothetical protein C8T65DRAFT_828509 [Cerioporus squamosus]